MKYAEMLDIMVKLHRIDEEELMAFKGRIRNFANHGIPNVNGTGSGAHYYYNSADLYEIHIACTLSKIGLRPDKIASVIKNLIKVDVDCITIVDDKIAPFDKENRASIFLNISKLKQDVNYNYSVSVAIEKDEILWGAEAIGKAIGLNARQAFHMLKKGTLSPAGAKIVCGRWCISHQKLIEFFRDIHEH